MTSTAVEIEKARAGIRTTLDNTLAALRRKASAEEVAKIMYTDDLVLAVASWKTFHGLSQFVPTLADWVKESNIKWTIEEPIKVSGDLAAVYIIEELPPEEAGKPPRVYRALWVFENGPNGWRCSREALVGSAPDHQ